jgi:hypothetical protein
MSRSLWAIPWDGTFGGSNERQLRASIRRHPKLAHRNANCGGSQIKTDDQTLFHT